MKKLILMFSLLVLVACNKESNVSTANDSGIYSGTLTVTANATPTSTPFVSNDVRYELRESNNGLLTLTMHSIRFAESMPMSLTIEIPSLQYAHENGVMIISSAVSPIVPYIGKRPYEGFQILDFAGQLSGKELTLNFTCNNPKIPVGDTTLDHKASYKGTLIE